MKLKGILLTTALTAMLGVGVFAGVSGNRSEPVEKAEAANSSWGLVGDGYSWTPKDRTKLTATGTSPHSIGTFTFAANSHFRFIDGDDWNASQIGWSNVTFGNAKSNFDDYGAENNIKCTKAGTYDFCIHWNGSKNVIGVFNEGTISSNPAIYYLDANWTPDRIYTFNDSGACQKQYGDWAGTTISTIDNYWGKFQKTATVNLAGSYGNVWRIPLNPFSTDTSFILNNTSGYQSGNTTISNGYGYYKSSGDSQAVLTSNANLGKAADFILYVENIRNAVAEDKSKSIAKYSICGISQSNIDNIVAKYNGLTSDVKNLVNTTTVTTYTGSYGSSEGTVLYSAIMNQLSSMTTSAKANSSIANLLNTNSTAATTTATVIASIMAVTAGTGFVLLKKKKITK